MSLLTVMILSGCTEWAAILIPTGSFVASQNAFSKTYGGLDIITVISTKKDIKTHARDKLQELQK
jgi:hypothetical protein